MNVTLSERQQVILRLVVEEYVATKAPVGSKTLVEKAGLGVGAVSTIENRRWRNAPSLGRYLAALGRGERPARELEELPALVRATERVMLGLRLDEPLPLDGLEDALDPAAVDSLAAGGLVARGERSLTLTRRGRFLGGGVTARLLA